MYYREREREIKTHMKNAKRDRGSVRGMIGMNMSYMFFCSVSPYRLEASDGRPSFSVLLFFFQSSFSTFSSPSASSSPSFCPPPLGYSIKEESGSGWMEASLRSKHSPALLFFDSFLRFLLSLLTFVGWSIFFLPGSCDTERGGAEDKEGFRERLRESRKGGKEQV